MLHHRARRLLAVIAMFAPVAGQAGDEGSREAALFDRPVAIRHVPPRSGDDPIGEIRCTYYPDFMVRETGTDSPAPGPAGLIPAADPSRRAPCDAAPAGREITLDTADFFLLGRKGPFLVFEAADPNGAIPFAVLDARTGRTIHADGVKPDGLQSVTLDGGRLNLRLTRAFNGSCSVLKDGPGCWAKLVREANIPARLAQSPPPLPACAAAYDQAKVAADDPNLITYDVDMSIDLSGQVQVTALGAIGCEPMP